jgi:hypothetical protein
VRLCSAALERSDDPTSLRLLGHRRKTALKKITPAFVHRTENDMKTLMAMAILGAGSMAVSAQDVFVLGGPGSTPVPPIVYQPPVVTGASAYPVCQSVVAAVPVTPYCGAYSQPHRYSGYYNSYNPNVIYIGGPGTCGPNYYDYGRCSTPNVIYFGREQAYRHGYNFRHCR